MTAVRGCKDRFKINNLFGREIQIYIQGVSQNKRVIYWILYEQNNFHLAFLYGTYTKILHIVYENIQTIKSCRSSTIAIFATRKNILLNKGGNTFGHFCYLISQQKKRWWMVKHFRDGVVWILKEISKHFLIAYNI